MSEVGDLVRLRTWRHYEPRGPRDPRPGAIWLDYTASQGKVAVMLVLGYEKRDGSDPLDPMVMMRALGWVPATEQATEAQP